MADNLKVKYKGEVYSISTNMLLSANEIEEFMDMIHHCFEKIHSTEEIRVIVLETWMMFEYYIRLALSYNKKDEPKDPITININDYMIMTGPYQDTKFVDSFANIDEDWFRKANKFNNTRNCAAHNYREEKIYRALGFNGERSFELSKQYCIDMLKDLCSFERISSEESIDFDLDS